jgi:hypothetical protein
MATAAQLKELRRKHHLGEFRRSSKHRHRVTRRKIHSFKFSRRDKMARKRKSYRHSKGVTSGVWANVIGVGGYIAYESILAPNIPLSANVMPIAEIAIGLWLSKKSGVVGNVGKAMVTLNTYKLLRTYVAPMLTGATSYFK